MKRFLYTVGALMGGSLLASAQTAQTDTTISRDIEIVKEYNPVIKEAGKINTMPELKTIDTKKITPSYSVWTSSFDPRADVVPTLDYALAKEPESNPYASDYFAKVGVGNYTSFLGEVYAPLYKTDKWLVDIYGKHNSTMSDITLSDDLYSGLAKDVESDAYANDNRIRASLLRSYRRSELSAFSTFGYNKFRYYGYDSFVGQASQNGAGSYDGYMQAFHNFDLNLRYKTKGYVEKWKYDLQANYQRFSNRNDVVENTIYTNFMGDYKMESSSLSAVFEMYNIIMDVPSDSSYLYDFKNMDNAASHTILKISPSYRFESNRGVFHIGVKGVFGIGQGRPGTIIPDIYGNIKILDDALYLYAGITGDYRVNNYRSLTALNPYIAPDVRVEDTYVPIDFYLGAKANVLKKVNLDAFVGYKVLNNPYFFVNKGIDSLYHHTFDVVYDKDAGLFNAGLTAIYNWTDKLGLTLQTKYYAWSLDKVDKAWQKPTFELDFKTSYQITDYLRTELSYEFSGGRYALVDGRSLSMDNIHDLSLGVNYSVLSFANLFLNLNNILASEYQNWYGYTAQRFNLMGGISLHF
ncbi:MAG: hypothetical protein MJZ33_03345 [Paludibacteraceae bacterium]|nr:hypothetical protein [Paludibacteraceae bacterium]